MSNHARRGLLALLLGAALVSAACGGTSPAPTPAPAAPATPTPAPDAGKGFTYSAPVLGVANAPVTIVEYGDYQ